MLNLNEQLVHGSLHSLRFSGSGFWKLLSRTSPWVTTRFIVAHARVEPFSRGRTWKLCHVYLWVSVQRQHQQKLSPPPGCAQPFEMETWCHPQISNLKWDTHLYRKAQLSWTPVNWTVDAGCMCFYPCPISRVFSGPVEFYIITEIQLPLLHFFTPCLDQK